MKDDERDVGAAGVSRRKALGLLGAVGVAALAGADRVEGRPIAGRRASADGEGGPGEVGRPGLSIRDLDCVVTPAQTEGPYFVDDVLERSDIRLDPTTGRRVDGVPLRLGIRVARVDGAACAPVEGALVDVWQCDAHGAYSDVLDANGLFDTRGQRFLRGQQRTDPSGQAEFVTIYPGWYRGRAVHIHFKVRAPAGEERTHELTSQLYFDDALTDRVHARPPYAANGPRDRRNDADGIFRRGESGSRLLLPVSPDGDGYGGEFRVGLRIA